MSVSNSAVIQMNVKVKLIHCSSVLTVGLSFRECNMDVSFLGENVLFGLNSTVTMATVLLCNLCLCVLVMPVCMSVCLCRAPSEICVMWTRRGRKNASEVSKIALCVLPSVAINRITYSAYIDEVIGGILLMVSLLKAYECIECKL